MKSTETEALAAAVPEVKTRHRIPAEILTHGAPPPGLSSVVQKMGNRATSFGATSAFLSNSAP